MVYNYERNREVTVTLTKGELYDMRMAVLKTANREYEIDQSPTGLKYVETLDALGTKLDHLLYTSTKSTT
jgi:hypothetical protein